MSKRGNARTSRAWDKRQARNAGKQLAEVNAAKALGRDAERYRRMRDRMPGDADPLGSLAGVALDEYVDEKLPPRKP